ncbi:hypothetical protein ACEI87_10190 [Clostridioides difficile]
MKDVFGFIITFIVISIIAFLGIIFLEPYNNLVFESVNNFYLVQFPYVIQLL